MLCTVYKSIKKIDHYLYLETEDKFSRVPEQLLSMLGQLEHVMDLELNSERKLARANVADVMSNLNDNGYYLQLPPTDEPST